MQRIELYVDDNNRIALGIFEPENSPYEKYNLKGREVYEYLKKLHHKKIIDVVEDEELDEATIYYFNGCLNLNECSRLLKRESLKPILKSVKQYYEKEQLKKIKNKKVKRTNKYIGKQIMATGTAAVIVASLFLGLNSSIDAKDVKNQNTSTISQSQTYIIDVPEQIPLEENIENIEEQNQIVDDKTPKEENLEMQEQNIPNTAVTVAYEDRSDTPKAVKTETNYGKLITKYAKMYGIDAKLVLAIATQERGIHSSVMDEGGATGLMQIQNLVWVDEIVEAYNFNTQKTDKVSVSLNKIQNLETNIQIGCMILQNAFKYMNYNPLAAIQCYNMGYGNMMEILRNYSIDTNRDVQDILLDMEDDGWLEYRDFITQGDQKYIENVFSWIGEDINIEVTKPDGSLVTMKITQKNSSKKNIN